MRSATDVGLREPSANQVIFPAARPSWYIVLLILFKFFCCIGTFITYDALDISHPVHFLLLVLIWSSIINGLLIRPFSTSISLKKVPWYKLIKYSTFQTTLKLLWFYGLQQIGPLRANLLTEHSNLAIYGIWATLLKGGVNSTKVKGTIWYIGAVVCLLIFDHGVSKPQAASYDSGYSPWLSLSQEGGIAMLLMMTVGRCIIRKFEHQLAREVIGMKQLDALSSIISSLLLIPFAIIIYFTQPESKLFSSNLLLALLVAVYVFMFNHSIESVCSKRLDPTRIARIASLTMFMMSFVINVIWVRILPDISSPVSSVPVAVILAFICCCFATLQLTSTSSKERWTGGDMSPEEMSEILPLYGFSAQAIRQSQSFLSFLKTTFNHIICDSNSRTIFYFLCVNLGFTCVELGYGMWTNSLGLISDGFHMLFDCTSLIMGLTASVIAQWKPSKSFPFGYGRIEVVSGFINGLFLTMIGVMVLIEAIGRLIDPPEVKTEKLLLIAVGGLVINVFGIILFSQMQVKHGHNHCHSHGGGHSHNANMQGVFLHIVADTMGSIAVIISSVLIDKYEWLIADPICSLILAVLIISSVLPLLKQSIYILLLRTPDVAANNIHEVINRILEVPSVTACANPQFWQYIHGLNIAGVQVECTGDSSEQQIIHQVTSVLQEAGFNNTTVEVVINSKPDHEMNKPTFWKVGAVPRKSLQDSKRIRDI